MRLEEGMYIRYLNQVSKISEVIGCNIELDQAIDEDGEEIWCLTYNDLFKDDNFKYDFNIINLIKIGDIIAIKEYIGDFSQVFILGIYEPELLRTIKEKINKKEVILVNVLSQEQFEKRSYKVGK